MVRDDYALAGLLLQDQGLNFIDTVRSDIRKGFVKDAEFCIRHQHQVHPGYPCLSSREFP